ncbi:AraC family transcriptional regulator [Paenibacillus camelliae]|uniref:AraC family transcriptional regulator n=1 Tax=Paenibacillus camelliae TaxID=512410 RepID=UPI00203E2411|nr:AraC family transcriptional regulator [Paenibacillus camelliae]MCM3632753.1 AraC family transcriptional regulator [Paenibacillus camelliae]
MNPYRKRFQFDGEFPFEYVYHDVKSAQNELPDHVHDWYEFVYVYSGRGTFFIDHIFYDAEPGDIFLIPGNTLHRSFPVEDDPKRSTALFFSATLIHAASLGDAFTYLQPFEAAKRNQSYRLSLPADAQERIIAILDQIHEEHSEAKVGYRQAIRLHIQHILLLLGRFDLQTIDSQQARHNSSMMPEWMTDVLSYADAHPEADLSLSALARHAAVTPSHFSRVFKRLTGMNVTDYVTAKRVMRAKELIQQSHMSISEIAEQCGFGSITHFHRKFKALTGMTPAQYKRHE